VIATTENLTRGGSPSGSPSCSLPSSSGISSLPLRVPLDRRKEKRLLPFGRLARPIKPRIGRLSWTSKGGNNLGGGKLGKRFGEGHGQILPLKKKSAMQKINLAKCPQCRQSTHMSNTAHAKPNFAEVTAKFFGITLDQAQAMINKADARNRATNEKGMALKESVAQGKILKGGIGA